jgi:hypothetical protein
MKKLILIICALFIITTGFFLHAEEKQITPFGAVCPSCKTYGYCRTPLSHTQAVQNLTTYYKARGFCVVVNRQFGRFLEANIYREGNLVERVVLDRQTGRIRPIY